MTEASFFFLVREELPEVEARMLAFRHPSDQILQSALENLLRAGGKRIRPTVALLAGQMLSAPRDGLLDFAAAIEMLHTATLVHDDLIDGATLRRGTPTLNSRWSTEATVLAGDYIFACAAYLGTQTHSLEVMQEFARTLITIISGELGQMFERSTLISGEEYERRIYAKTAALFELASRGGALLCNESPEVVHSLGRYGRCLGMAFQIVDDVLDFTGQSVRIGKPVGSDLRQGLITLPVLYYQKRHPEDTRFAALMDPNRPSGTDVDQLVETIGRSEAIQESLAQAHRYASEAKELLEGLPENRYRQALLDLTEYVVSRDL
ncbi:MAG: polyprenyl synthetase family protein [Anaerolineales bacterium]